MEMRSYDGTWGPSAGRVRDFNGASETRR
jgi:hypothetical protein